MSEICDMCGLPKPLCVCDTIAKEEQKIKIKTVKKKFGKINTLIEGLENIDIKEIAKKLKTILACGGTIKGKTIELQGNHVKKVKEELVKLGFKSETIQS